MGIVVLYKDYCRTTGQEVIKEKSFDVWSQEGNYTLLYEFWRKDLGAENVPNLIIPTHNIHWIKPELGCCEICSTKITRLYSLDYKSLCGKCIKHLEQSTKK
ncbi:hypothetical protein BH753_gp073 [Bacillus phage Shbh1]|uniref:Uncharacterized protein n=1 Tax=Bacillus phage Shbh1 TaxID=1796992 RepID=A0A142F198_9CAUD|nr:hypothetical protein BH753_gp073 [Bacillus phage Shbh1]AMQ66555.1 hypothetical protein [Bacillus phage Shbh1]